MTNYDIVESATLTQDAADATGKRWNALLIKSGWGSKGYYTEEALKKDGPLVFKAGTPIFLDHQTPEERDAKPFGSVQNLAGELVTDAVWDVEEGGLTAEIEIFEHERARVRSLAKRVGLSIRATTVAERGTMEGRSGRIVTGLVGARSVDLVVRAGAGGQLLDVLESEDDTEMEEQQMDEAIEKLSKTLDEKFAALDKRFTDLEESLTAEAEPVVEDAKAEEVDITKTVTELITAELAKFKESLVANDESADDEGTEENAEEVEESAVEIKLPSFWAVKENK
jgi:hypothetical protein